MTGIEEFTSQYGLVRKIDAFGYLDYLKSNPDAPRKHGKVVLVTADTPLKASRGEGKTTTTIALIDALNARGIDAAAVLRQPSMGITAAGSKGGASGGGKASLTHPELIDWGLTGEMAAIAAAQNLLVSFAEKAVDEGRIDTILVPRVSEVPSRSLRQITVDRRQEQRGRACGAHPDLRDDADRGRLPFDGGDRRACGRHDRGHQGRQAGGLRRVHRPVAHHQHAGRRRQAGPDRDAQRFAGVCARRTVRQRVARHPDAGLGSDGVRAARRGDRRGRLRRRRGRAEVAGHRLPRIRRPVAVRGRWL